MARPVPHALTPELARGLSLEASTGLLISDVIPASPGAAAGLHAGDLVMTLDTRGCRRGSTSHARSRRHAQDRQ